MQKIIFYLHVDLQMHVLIVLFVFLLSPYNHFSFFLPKIGPPCDNNDTK